MRFSASVNLRPVRIGFLVKPGDFKSIRKILRLNACLWGGAFNPIIPVFDHPPARWTTERLLKLKGTDVANGYIRFFEPDILVEATPGLAIRLGWKSSPTSFSSKRLILLEEFVTQSQHRLNFESGLDVSDLYAELYETEFKFQHRRETKVVRFENLPKENAFFDVMAGCFPEEEAFSHIRQGYEQVFKPIALKHSADSLLSLLKDPNDSPLSIGSEKLEIQIDSSSDPTIFIFDPTDGQDLIDFWNLRQFERDVIPISVEWIKECAQFIVDFITENYRPLPGNPNGLMITTSVEFSRSITETQARNLIETYIRDAPDGSFSTKLWYTHIWANFDDQWMRQGTRARISSETTEIANPIVESESSISYSTLSPKFLGKAQTFGDATWVNVLRPNGIGTDDDLATVYPTNIYQPEYPVLRSMEWATVSREGWIFPQHYKGHRQYLYLNKGRDAFIGWFKTKGIEATPSDAGRVAEQIIATAGGLRGCNMFSDRRIVELLDDMAINKVEHISTDGQTFDVHYPDKSVPVGRWEALFNKLQQDGKFRRDGLEKFIESSVLRAGLQIKCRHCSQKNWYDIKALDFDLTCSRCLKIFPFPQSAASLRELKWFYRVVGPFATPGFASGGYTVALTLRLFTHLLSISESNTTWTTGLDLRSSDGAIELDFALWYQRRIIYGEEDEPSLVFGEAKSFAVDALTISDIKRLKFLAEKNPGAYIAVAVLKDKLSPKDVKKLTSLAKWGRRRRYNGHPRNPVIVITGTELFAEWHLKDRWKKFSKAAEQIVNARLDVSRLMNFADATQQIHLDMPSFAFDAAEKAKARRAKMPSKGSSD